MAKSARASSKKANKSRLRAEIFGPVEQARLERLSARLQDLSNKPKADNESDVPMEATDGGGREQQQAVAASSDEAVDLSGAIIMKEFKGPNATKMDIEAAGPERQPARSGKKRVEKKKRKHNSIVFDGLRKKKKASRK